MNEVQSTIRLECLKVALATYGSGSAGSEEVLKAAQEYLDFVNKDDEPKA